MLGFLILGLILLFVGIRNKRKRKLLAKNGTKVTAKVIDNYESELGDRTLYYPIVEFSDRNNNKQKVKMTIGTTAYKTVGSNIEIVYDPNDYDSEVLEYSNSTSITDLIFIIVGSIFTFIGAISTILKLLWNHITNN